ncbi:MAG TPA: NMP kinase, partial [Ignisphaera sp.]|nr:NMP kinase [Ignisphaera sp.]
MVAISGTPGVGKSSISRKLAEKLSLIHIDLSQAVIENKLYTEYDEYRKSFIIDEDRVREFIKRKYMELGPYILDSHYAEIAPR